MSDSKKKTSKFASVFLSLSTAVWLSGAMTVMPITAGALTADELKAQIQDLLDQINQLQSQLDDLEGDDEDTGAGEDLGFEFTKNLKMGDRGDDVSNLQESLATDSEIYPEGLVTGYFGPLTKKAVINFQEAYADEILEPLGLTKGTGFVGMATREKLNELYGGAGGGGDDDDGGDGDDDTTPPAKAACEDGIDNDTDTKIDYPNDPGCASGADTDETDGVTTPPVAGTLKVETGIHPASTLFPLNSVRVPFTVVKLTAPADKDITVSSITVERTGLAVDAAFSGVVLLDETGTQVGLAKTLNSVHQVVLNEPFTVTKGTTKIMSLAGNGATASNSRGGQIAYLTLNSVNAGSDVTIDGTLPITGVGHTVNESLTIGSVTMARGPLDPNRSDGTAVDKEIGLTGYIFTSVKITAGSAEKVYLESIRWNQSGSISKGDLENVKTYVDGTSYDTVVTSDGKYYTTTFPVKSILIDKGNSKEVYIKGDIIGGSGRTIDFDLYRTTDIGLKGENLGYGINPPTTGANDPTDDSSNFSTGNPWFDASQVTVTSGTITVSKSTTVPAQNIAINLASQPLGGFEVEVKGEPIQVSSMTFRVSLWAGTSAAASTQDITNISLVDENGTVAAGPVDITASSPTVTFSDTVTFPIGKHVYTLKGKLGTDFANNDTIAASTSPRTDWTSTGQVTGNSITENPNSAVTGNTMTVKSGAIVISVSSIPLAQTVIAGSNSFLFANYVLDAGNSGEDVLISTFPVEYNAPANPTTLSNCQLYDGTTSLTTGSNIVSPSAAASSSNFTFDTSLIIPRGTSKTLSMKCNVAGSATANNTFAFGYDSGSSPSFTGKTSGQDIVETENDNMGQIMTVAASGTYTVTNDSTPGYTIVSAGTTGSTLLKLKFSATTEDMDIKRVAFQLAGTASNTPVDLVGRKVMLYDSAAPSTSIGEAIFPTGDYATSTLSSAFIIPAGGSKTMLVKGDIAAISNAVGPLTASGDLLRVAYDGDSNGVNNGNYAVGKASGSNVAGTSGDVTATGVRIFKSYPTFTKVDLSSTERTLTGESRHALYKFSIKANNGDVYLYKTTFTIGSSTESATTSVYGLYAFTDSAFSVADSVFTTDGLLNAGNCVNGINSTDPNFNILDIYMDSTGCATATTTYKIPSGETRWLKLDATIGTVNRDGGTAVETITVQLDGDAAFTAASAATGDLMHSAATTDTDTNNDFIWSPNSTSTSIGIGDLDFANGYGMTGLPTTNMASESLSR